MHEVEHRPRDEQLVGRPSRDRRLQSAGLRGRQPSRVGEQRLDEVKKRHVRKRRLGLRRASSEDAEPMLFRETDAVIPQARLADARLPLEQQRMLLRPLREQRVDRRTLFRASDDRRVRRSQPHSQMVIRLFHAANGRARKLTSGRSAGRRSASCRPDSGPGIPRACGTEPPTCAAGRAETWEGRVWPARQTGGRSSPAEALLPQGADQSFRPVSGEFSCR